MHQWCMYLQSMVFWWHAQADVFYDFESNLFHHLECNFESKWCLVVWCLGIRSYRPPIYLHQRKEFTLFVSYLTKHCQWHNGLFFSSYISTTTITSPNKTKSPTTITVANIVTNFNTPYNSRSWTPTPPCRHPLWPPPPHCASSCQPAAPRIAWNCPIGMILASSVIHHSSASILALYWVGIFISQSHTKKVSKTSLSQWDREAGSHRQLGPVNIYEKANCIDMCKIYTVNIFTGTVTM